MCVCGAYFQVHSHNFQLFFRFSLLYDSVRYCGWTKIRENRFKNSCMRKRKIKNLNGFAARKCVSRAEAKLRDLYALRIRQCLRLHTPISFHLLSWGFMHHTNTTSFSTETCKYCFFCVENFNACCLPKHRFTPAISAGKVKRNPLKL